MIGDFNIFFNNAFKTAEFWYIVSLTAVLSFLQRKNFAFL